MGFFRGTFQALGNRNFRLYFAGSSVSVTGEWMQKVAEAWLVLQLTGSGTLLGVTVALQHLPTLVIGPFGGLLADRMDKHRVLMWTQAAAGLLAALLGLLVLTDLVEVWMVMAWALLLGTIRAFDEPAKHSFIAEIVPADTIANAVTLNSITRNAAKIVGPAIAGIIIAQVGLAPSFLINGASYLAVVAALVAMDSDELMAPVPTAKGKRQLREGLRYVRDTPALMAPLLLMTVSGLFAYEWNVTIPLFAHDAFNGDAQTIAMMFSAMGLGAVVGGLLVAGRLKPTAGALVLSGCVLGVVMLVAAASPVLIMAVVVLAFVGAGSIAFRAISTSVLQIQARPEMRGRVMSLLAMAFFGTTPIGAPLMGWIAETLGSRFALGLGGVATLVATWTAWWYIRRYTSSVADEDERTARHL